MIEKAKRPAKKKAKAKRDQKPGLQLLRCHDTLPTIVIPATFIETKVKSHGNGSRQEGKHRPSTLVDE